MAEIDYDITSPANPTIKWARSLHQKKNRRAENLITVEGSKEVNYALKAGLALQTLFVCPDIFGDQALPAAEQTYTISRRCFERLAYRFTSDGLLGIFKQPERNLADFKLSKQPFILIVEAIEKPGNLGAILRVADGAGADGVIICDEHTDLWNPNVIRASVGTIFSVQTALASKEAAYKFLTDNKITAYAAELTDHSINYTTVDMRKPCAIILGTEHDSVTDFWLERVTTVDLPMHGWNSSLNVSTAGAILAYEVVRQRDK